MDSQIIGLKIARLRKEKHLTGIELARRAGLSQPQLSRLENGKQGLRSATLTRLASALEVQPAYFFEEEQAALSTLKQKEKQSRKAIGQSFTDEIFLGVGNIALTPGYEQILRKLSVALSKDDCDRRTLRQLLNRILGMNNTEREKLFVRLVRK
ncbi:MAG: helix-turn-helix transcriptional regulator [Planctomycetes bacterium]|nr:helix-turn-helix transcriptional regulator [Planctomycetota bacterium]